MVDPRKLLEATKAEVLDTAQRQMEAAQQRAAEIDRDLSDIDRLTQVAQKYGLRLEEANTAAATPEPPAKKPLHGAARGNPNSATARSKAEAEKLIRLLGRPIPLAEMYEHVTKQGIKIGGKNPRWILSAYLTEHPGLVATKRGWWIKGVPMPPANGGEHTATETLRDALGGTIKRGVVGSAH